MIYVTSFGYRHGVPPDSDLVFDVRFLPNPNYIPKFKKLTGRHPSVARYIRSKDDAEVAEIAVTVADDWQGRGLGRALLDRVTYRARHGGVHRFSALVRPARCARRLPSANLGHVSEPAAPIRADIHADLNLECP